MMHKASSAFRTAALLAVVWLPVTSAGASEVEPVDFRQASFSYSTEPSKLLLFQSHSGGLSQAQNTLSLFGDGRLVYRELLGGEAIKERQVMLEAQDVEGLLRFAVDHGLAEWDLTRVQARQVEILGKLYVSPDDATKTLVMLSIDDYERGDFRVPHIERKIRFQGAAFMDRRFPEILEIKGLVELNRRLFGYFQAQDDAQ